MTTDKRGLWLYEVIGNASAKLLQMGSRCVINLCNAYTQSMYGKLGHEFTKSLWDFNLKE